ncbi:MAG: hypothetical protein M1840_004824 [Geoglossum simile]|nr:MAG: hypothetical protein M1840_004824 [Geoglossum simile]
MAEAFVAVGLAASIVTFVDVSAKVLHRLREFYSTDEGMPGVFQDITTQLRLIADTMTRIEEGCKDYYARWADRKDAPSPTDSTLRRARKAIASVLKEKDVAGIRGALETYKSTLTLHFVERYRDSNTTAKESAYYEIPPLRVSRFVGRVKLLEEIGVSFASITRDRSCPKIVVLLAMGGQGKTQLALEYCRVARASGRFQAIFWVDASSSNTASHGFETIAAKISNKKWVFKNTEETVAFVKDTLGRWQSPWLIVFDNYDQPGEFGNITAYFPQGETGSILLTSRHAGSERLGVTIRITGMAENEGLELLLRQSRLEKSGDNAMEGKKIIEKLGYLPLAIDQAGAYISARNLPLQLFAEHYDRRKEVVLKHTPLLWEYQRRLGGDKGEATLSSFTTWELSFQQIGKDENERTMVGHFLTLSAFFDTSNVGEDLFRSYLVSTNDPPKWMKLFTSGGTWDQHKYQDTVVELLSLSLLQNVDIGASESRFSLHPLVADWLKLRLDFGSRQRYTIEAMVFLGNHIYVQDIDLLPSQTKMDMMSHADICLQNDKEYFLELDESNLTLLIEPALSFGFLYHDRCRYQVAEAMYRRALAGYEKALGPEHTSILTTVDSLGCLYADQGKLTEAEAMFRRALVGREKVLGSEHMSTLHTIKNLGGIYSEQGKLVEAEAMYQQALAGSEKTLGPEHELTLCTVYGLGKFYVHQGKLAEAETMYQRVLTGRKGTLDPNDRLMLYAAHNLANIYSKWDMFAGAEALYRWSLVGKENVLGPEHISTLATVGSLGNVYADQGRLAEAEAMYQRALVGEEKALGPDHTSTLSTVNNLGRFYAEQDKLAEAEALYKRYHAWGRES